MKTGKLIHKNNLWFVRTSNTGRELDEIELEYYPLSLTESNVELKHNKTVEFEIKNVSYVDLDGLGEELVKWSIVNEKE